MRQKYLMQIHQGHQGIEACRSRARELVFWVNINSDLKELVAKCDLCQSQQNSTAIVQKYVSGVPPHPWHTLGSDLFYHERIDFLVIVDYFSKYMIVRKIPKFYIQCSHQRTRNDLLRVWKATRSSEVTVDPATQAKNSNSSCRIGLLSIEPVLHIIHRAMVWQNLWSRYLRV